MNLRKIKEGTIIGLTAIALTTPIGLQILHNTNLEDKVRQCDPAAEQMHLIVEHRDTTGGIGVVDNTYLVMCSGYHDCRIYEMSLEGEVITSNLTYEPAENGYNFINENDEIVYSYEKPPVIHINW